ncbi:hypothetical protein MKX01_029669 [Papaver californicum]|nr:hypothetical protein MKX01_029669 [Papaver californicum]
MHSKKDHFNLIPDDDVDVIAIKKVMRNAYKKYRHDIHQAYCEALKIGSHKNALTHPPKTCPNKRDWAHMCSLLHHRRVQGISICLLILFTFDVLFKKNSERGRLAAAAKKINHNSGKISHISYEYKLVSAEQPCDPVTLFRLTHKSKNMNAKCKEIKVKKMKDMKKAADQGETNDTPEEIYHKVRDAEYLGKRRRKAHPTPFNEDDAEEDDEDADIHERGDAFENNEREFEEEDGETYEDDQEEGDNEYPDREFEEYEEEEREELSQRNF